MTRDEALALVGKMRKADPHYNHNGFDGCSRYMVEPEPCDCEAGADLDALEAYLRHPPFPWPTSDTRWDNPTERARALRDALHIPEPE